MAVKTKPDKLTLDVRQADAAGLSYGRWRFEETERMGLNICETSGMDRLK